MGCIKLSYYQSHRLNESDLNHKTDLEINPVFFQPAKAKSDNIVENRGDYYPFGMGMPNRTFTAGNFEGYRFGYQGSEKDNEIYGEGNAYTTYFRELDVRLGRWFAIDPKTVATPWESPYVCMNGNPIQINDILGDFGNKRIAERKRRKAIRQFGKEKVGTESSYDPNKKEWYFALYKDDQNKTNSYFDGNSFVISAVAPEHCFTMDDFSNYKSENKLYTPHYASIQVKFVPGAGASFALGWAQDKYGGRTWFFTLGGAVGFESGVSASYGRIYDKNGKEFKVGNIEGAGYQYGGGISFFSFQKSGDDKTQDFEHSKEGTYTMIDGGAGQSSGLAIKILSKMTKIGKVLTVGGSHGWTQSYLFGQNKKAKSQ